MSIWQHLFLDDREYAPATHILAGLTFDQAGVRPGHAAHSIYEELFHTTRWQRSMLRSARGHAAVAPDPDWPEHPTPPDAESWAGLVQEFLAGSEEAVALGDQTERLDERLPEGITVRERLELLAVHTAYHLGKIVLLRQLLGSWTPSPEDA